MRTTLAAVAIASASLAQVQEGAATCASGVIPICYGDHAPCGLSTPSEIDLYRFPGQAGDNVRITVSGLSLNLDCRFEVLDSGGGLVESSACNTCFNCRCSTSKDFVLPATDLYTILVSDNGQNEAGSYVLDLQRLPPELPARFIDFGVPTNVTINHASDHDFLFFEADAGDLVRISLSGVSLNLDSAYVLYAPDGSVVSSGSCSTCFNCTCSHTSPNLSLPMAGRYALMVHDLGWNETGTTNVTVTCILGTCPPNWTPVGTNYCSTNPNSTGNPASMLAWGSEAVADATLFLYATDAPTNVTGLIYMGQSQVSFPFGDGTRCVGNPPFRFPVVSSCSRGELRCQPDFANLPNHQQFLPSSTWNFQAWFRDPAAAGSGFNLSDGLSLTFH